MKPSLSIKTLLRSPARTILTFILLGVVTFALLSQTAEYAITAREFNEAARRYVGIGTAEITPPLPSEKYNPGLPIPMERPHAIEEGIDTSGIIEPFKDTYQPLTEEQISAITALPYIAITDKRYMTAGISDDYYRLDDGFYSYSFTSRCVIEATLTDYYTKIPFSNILTLSDCRVLAGTPPWGIDMGSIEVKAYTHKFFSEDIIAGSEGPARMSFVVTPLYEYYTEYLENNLTPGNRYVFTLRYDTLGKEEYYLSDHLSEPWCDAILPVTGEPDNYLELDKFTPLRTLIEVTNQDIYTFDIVYTEDMSSIMRFALEKMAIIDGRALTPEDSESGARICVISRELANAYSLEVGDAITMRLGSKPFEQYKSLGALAVYPERFEPPGDAATLEIVGIYTDTDGLFGQSTEPNWSYSANTIFTPKSLMPIPESELSGHMLTPAEFSFKVGNAWDIPAFLEEAEPVLSEMGLKLIFNDGGWSDIAGSFQTVKQASVIKIAILSASVFAATWITVYLFIGRKKKEYAVMRALGVTKKLSSRSMLIPLMAVVVISVLAGSGAAWIYTVKTVAQSSAFSALEGVAVDASVPAGVVLACVLGELALTLVIALILLRMIGALSPLVLLQDNGTRAGKRTKTVGEDQVANGPMWISASASITAYGSDERRNVDISPLDRELVTATRMVRSFYFIFRYIWTHMRRAFWKSALVVLVAALLLGAVGQLSMMAYSYTELFENTVVVAYVTGGMRHALVTKFKESGYVSDIYYARGESRDIASSTTQLIITNNIARYTGEDIDIIYAEGYDASVMDSFGDVIILGNTLMEVNGLSLGETVDVLPPNYVIAVTSSAINRYRFAHPDDPITDAEILEQLHTQIIVDIGRSTRKFTIAGVILTPSGKYDRIAFTPGITGSSVVYGTDAQLDIVQLELADNYRADEFRKFGEETIGHSINVGKLFLMDTSKLENIENSMRVLKALYPMALAAALLIGSFLSCLIILQTSKEAAIMRVLGTTKRKTRAILTIELSSLNIAGLIVGFCALFIYNGRGVIAILNRIYLFASLFFVMILVCAIVCSALATQRSALELLQTKE